MGDSNMAMTCDKCQGRMGEDESHVWVELNRRFPEIYVAIQCPECGLVNRYNQTAAGRLSAPLEPPIQFASNYDCVTLLAWGQGKV